MFGLGVPELLLILVIVVLIFGAGRLPQLGKGIGEGIKNFKESIRGARRTTNTTRRAEAFRSSRWTGRRQSKGVSR